ncbi:alkaline-phosphatase-like protein [Fennellomyces sp. T-0311]|nr:alkaline-phosphatase-like protein [Fennellomyces sp. T-0311]
MPRIKALTTGTVPSFLDAILNIAESDTSSSLQHHDNWVLQFKQAGNRTIHFFGDDTWIRLFPNAFTKFDGTTSFYVSDTIEVDLNVTRHIQPAFSEQDWDAIILHYLGLDHVGHLGGPYSPLMKPKQREMDQAVERIYEIVAEQDAERVKHDPDARGTLIILCGDHGMNELGNHGGSSVGETSAAMVFMSPRYESRPTIKKHVTREDVTRILGFPVLDQVDVVPTLAALFAFPIPKNSLGKVIPDLLHRKTDQWLRALQLNAFQLGHLLGRMVPDLDQYLLYPNDQHSHGIGHIGALYSHAIAQHNKFMMAQDSSTAESTSKAYLEFIHAAQSQLSSTAKDYKLTDMVTGICLMFISAVVLGYQAIFHSESDPSLWKVNKIFAFGTMVAYVVSMFASSFIEEEHCIWYYFTSTTFVLLASRSFKVPNMPINQQTRLALLWIVQLILFRVAIVWDSGIKGWITEHIKWHMLALALSTPLVLGLYTIWRSKTQGIETSSGAGYIISICKAVLFLIMTLTSSLVLMYKARAEPHDDIPELYGSWMKQLEFAGQLDQVALGKLIYNYYGAGMFMLAALVYATKRASVLNFEGHEQHQPKHYLDVLLCMVTPVLILFTRSDNAPLFAIYTVQLFLLRTWHSALSSSGSNHGRTWVLTAIAMCMTQAAFFMGGRSNSIAAIDLSNAYIGVSGYDTVLIGWLTFCSNWSTSIWWCIAGWILVADEQGSWWAYATAQSALFGIFVAVLSVAVTALREHLFIWTVFSPKYLYQVAWTCLFHWCMQVLIGTVCVRMYSFRRSLPDQQ